MMIEKVPKIQKVAGGVGGHGDQKSDDSIRGKQI